MRYKPFLPKNLVESPQKIAPEPQKVDPEPHKEEEGPGPDGEQSGTLETLPLETLADSLDTFSSEEEAAFAPLEPQDTLYKKEDIDKARQDSWKQGYVEGFEAGQEQRHTLNQQEQTQVLTSLTQAFSQLQEPTLPPSLVGDMVEVAREMVACLLPAYTKAHGEEEILSLIRESLPKLLERARLVIKVSEAHSSSMESRIRGVASSAGFSGELHIVPDGSLGPSDVAIEWTHGSLVRREETLWQEVQKAMETFKLSITSSGGGEE